MKATINELADLRAHSEDMIIQTNANNTRFLITFLDQDSIGESYSYAIGNKEAALVFSHFHHMTDFDTSDFVKEITINEFKDYTGVNLYDQRSRY